MKDILIVLSILSCILAGTLLFTYFFGLLQDWLEDYFRQRKELKLRGKMPNRLRVTFPFPSSWLVYESHQAQCWMVEEERLGVYSGHVVSLNCFCSVSVPNGVYSVQVRPVSTLEALGVAKGTHYGFRKAYPVFLQFVVKSGGIQALGYLFVTSDTWHESVKEGQMLHFVMYQDDRSTEPMVRGARMAFFQKQQDAEDFYVREAL